MISHHPSRLTRSPIGPPSSLLSPTAANNQPSTSHRLSIPAIAKPVAMTYPQSSRINNASILFTRTTQLIYDAAREANGPSFSVEEDEDVGHMTRRIGKSLVQLETRSAVEIALGVAWRTAGVRLWNSLLS